MPSVVEARILCTLWGSICSQVQYGHQAAAAYCGGVAWACGHAAACGAQRVLCILLAVPIEPGVDPGFFTGWGGGESPNPPKAGLTWVHRLAAYTESGLLEK